MSEKLVIKNFGPIKSAEIELKRFTVLIGEQATGKSTIAKLLAVCRYFSYIQDTKITPGFLEGLREWGMYDFLNDDCKITYDCDDYTISFSNSQDKKRYGSILSPKSIRFSDLQNGFDGYTDFIPSSFFLNMVATVMDNPFFLPVERGLQSIFSLGKSSIQNISDSLFNQLAKLDQVGRVFNSEISIEPLHITYKNESGRGFIKKDNDEKFYSLNNAASGYQTSIPIVLVSKYYHERRRKNKTFIIEEPELNLFPSAQKELMYYLVQEINKYQSKLLITSHSPYTLTSLSNLMTAYKVAQDSAKREKVAKILDERYWLNPEDISAYMLKPDGTVEDIVDREEGLINSDRIDSISEQLNTEFEQLLDIEFRTK